MIIIKISDPKEEKSILIRKLFSFSATKKLSESWILKVSFQDNLPWLWWFEIKKGYLLQAYLSDENKRSYCIFSWFVEERAIARNVVSLVAYDFVWYTKHRFIQSDYTFTATPVKDLVSRIISDLNAISPLPFSLWVNDCEEVIDMELSAFTTLYDILKELTKKVNWLEFRHSSKVNKNSSIEKLDVSLFTWSQLDWVWSDNATINQRSSNVISWEFRDSFWNFCNYWRDDNWNIIKDQESIDEWLIFEKYESNPEKTPESLTAWDWLPKITPDVKITEIPKIHVWDRKAIRLIAKLNWWKFEYNWIIQETVVSSNNNWGTDFSVKVWEKVVEQKNLLDKTLANLAASVKKIDVNWGWGSQPDMSQYATKTYVQTEVAKKANISHTHAMQDVTWLSDAIDAINTALDGKASSVHTHVIANIDWLSDALNNKANATHTHETTDVNWLDDTIEDLETAIQWKANSVHSHQISDITWLQTELSSKASADEVYIKDEVDELLEDKADTNHTHEISDVNWLQSALNWKADSSHNHQISDVDWLQSALNNKSDTNHTHNISDVDWLQTALDNKAAATHTHTIADTTGLQTALDSKANASEVYTKTEIDNKGFITDTVNNLVNYYTKNETYTKTEIDNKLSQFWSFKRVSVLPTTDIKTTVIYLLWPIGTWADKYEEYIYDTTDGWVKIWETSVDLTNYFNKENDSADDIDEWTVHLFMTATERQKLANQSGTNTGDETTASIKEKLGAASSTTDWYLTKEDWSKFNNKQDAISDADDIDEWTSHKFMTAAERSKLAWIEAWAEKNTVTGVKWSAENDYRTWNINITKENIGLWNVDNTSDADKPISTAVQAALNNKANSVHTHAISDITDLQTTLNQKALKTQIKYFVITEDMVTVTTDATKWVAPYNTSYWYTNITINSWIDNWIEWAAYIFLVDSEMVVASAYRNVRVRIWDTGDWKPVMNRTTTILAWSYYFLKTQNRIFIYKEVNVATGALHMVNDTTYSTMTSAEVTWWTSTSARLITAARFKEWVEHYLANIATPTNNSDAVNKKYVDDIKDAIDAALDWKASATHTHSQYQLISNMVTTLANADNDHYPTTKAVYDAITQAWGWDMMKATYDPNNKNADAFDYNNFIHTPTIWDATLTIEDSEWNEVGTFKANATVDKTITLPDSWIDTNAVNALIDIKLWSFDWLFQIKTGLYKILNSIDENDELWLQSWDTWQEIVADAVSMSLISHCYLVMTYVANSPYAMWEIVNSQVAAKEVSECWNSISIIAREEKASEIYLGSELWITNLFTYQTAQDAFFTTTARKTQIINQNIMIIVNSDTLLESLYEDTIVNAAIVSHPNAITTIAWDENKLSIVLDNTAIVNAISTNSTALSEIVSDEDVFAVWRTNSTIMTAISTNSTALSTISDSDFFTYILENATYLNSCANSTSWKAKINSYAADDLLPAIYYWTGDLGYSTFAELAASDSAMEIVQGNAQAMLIIESNDEAKSYLLVPTEYQAVERVGATSSWAWTGSSWQYIDTWYPVSDKLKVEFKIYWNQPWSSSNDIFSSDRGWTADWFWLIAWYYNFYAWTTYAHNFNDWQIHTWEFSKTWLYKDGTLLVVPSNNTKTFTWLNLYLFALNRNWAVQEHATWRIYYLKMYYNWTLVRDFIPCYRKSDNVIWFRDRVNKVFYTNRGSGSFTKWGNI